jgi:hypothetical protein
VDNNRLIEAALAVQHLHAPMLHDSLNAVKALTASQQATQKKVTCTRLVQQQLNQTHN